jgi:hypothetical protein
VYDAIQTEEIGNGEDILQAAIDIFKRQNAAQKKATLR